MEVLLPILYQVLALIAITMGLAVVGLIRRWLKAKLSKEEFEFLDRLAEAAVWAVEQKGSGVFTTKKAAAQAIIGDQLMKANMYDRFRSETIDAAIEANVGNAFHFGKHTREEES